MLRVLDCPVQNVWRNGRLHDRFVYALIDAKLRNKLFSATSRQSWVKYPPGFNSTPKKPQPTHSHLVLFNGMYFGYQISLRLV